MLENDIVSFQHPKKSKCDELGRVFLAAPMSGFETSQDYETHRFEVLRILSSLRSLDSVESVYYAGETIDSTGKFDSSKDAFTLDLRNIEQCNIFVLLYPFKVLTSALVEVGIALGLGKPTCIVVNDRSDLPYMLREAEQRHSAINFVKPIKIFEADGVKNVCNAVEDFMLDNCTHIA